MGPPPDAVEMGRLVGGWLEVLQGLLPLAGTGGLDPGSLVWPERRMAEVRLWDLVGAGAEGCQLGVQGQKDAAGPVGVGAAAVEVPDAEVLGLAVEGLLGTEKENTKVRVSELERYECLGW